MKFARSMLPFLTIAWFVVSGCGTPPERTAEEAPLPATNPADGFRLPARASSLPPPEPEEVRAKVARIFDKAVTIDTEQNVFFTTGDFNGDLSEDLVVRVKPSPGGLPQINDELADWKLVDPLPPRGRVRVEEQDALLALIHGFQSDGWRNREATQSYLIKSISGSPLVSRPLKQPATSGDSRTLPHVRGDVIAQTVSGQDGFLYFDGATYVWYDPLRHPAAPRRPLAHQSRRVQ